jgi:hypothetical protein
MTNARYLALALLLLGSGEVLRRIATFENAFATAQEQLATGNPAETPASEIGGGGVGMLASLPVIGQTIRTDLLRHGALTAYWRGDYATLSSAAASGPVPAVTPAAEAYAADSVTRFIAANAAFRDLARQPASREALVRGLDGILKAYLSVFELDPNAVDAAYNYEFVSRVRGAIATGRSNSIKLPSESTMHGEKGEPPAQTKPGEINIIVPLTPEERQEQIDPQAGTVPQRKG